MDEAERRERASAYWFNVVRPRLVAEPGEPADTPEQARARLLEMSGMSESDFDALPDAPDPPTFEKLRAK